MQYLRSTLGVLVIGILESDADFEVSLQPTPTHSDRSHTYMYTVSLASLVRLCRWIQASCLVEPVWRPTRKHWRNWCGTPGGPSLNLMDCFQRMYHKLSPVYTIVCEGVCVCVCVCVCDVHAHVCVVCRCMRTCMCGCMYNRPMYSMYVCVECLLRHPLPNICDLLV